MVFYQKKYKTVEKSDENTKFSLILSAK